MSFTNLNSACLIYRRTNTGNNITPNYQNVLLHSVNCVIDELNSKRVIRKEGDKILADHIIYIDYLEDIKMRDVIEVGEDKFKIFRIHNPNRLNRHLEIYCLKYERGSDPYDS